jgi:hypothetical protein
MWQRIETLVRRKHMQLNNAHVHQAIEDYPVSSATLATEDPVVDFTSEPVNRVIALATHQNATQPLDYAGTANTILQATGVMYVHLVTMVMQRGVNLTTAYLVHVLCPPHQISSARNVTLRMMVR